jgi:hypothetical protein
VETSRFKYNNLKSSLFWLYSIKSPTDQVNINGSNIETPGARRQLGSTGWYLIDFTNVEIGSPMTISIESLSKMTVWNSATRWWFFYVRYFSIHSSLMHQLFL